MTKVMIAALVASLTTIAGNQQAALDHTLALLSWVQSQPCTDCVAEYRPATGAELQAAIDAASL